ncbi:hypothetical protein TWF481_002644 [Arthrobotrys musiformis]|uniref:Uncharacterized protein n=1 Tax=Arthrobotrys musiformis TaxID=47236 RepID=A0AAV9VSS3_9PEZI
MEPIVRKKNAFKSASQISSDDDVSDDVPPMPPQQRRAKNPIVLSTSDDSSSSDLDEQSADLGSKKEVNSIAPLLQNPNRSAPVTLATTILQTGAPLNQIAPSAQLTLSSPPSPRLIHRPRPKCGCSYEWKQLAELSAIFCNQDSWFRMRCRNLENIKVVSALNDSRQRCWKIISLDESATQVTARGPPSLQLNKGELYTACEEHLRTLARLVFRLQTRVSNGKLGSKARLLNIELNVLRARFQKCDEALGSNLPALQRDNKPWFASVDSVKYGAVHLPQPLYTKSGSGISFNPVEFLDHGRFRNWWDHVVEPIEHGSESSVLTEFKMQVMQLYLLPASAILSPFCLGLDGNLNFTVR